MISISAGNHAQALAYGAAARGHRRARRHVAGRERGEDRGDPRLRRRGRPRGARPRPRPSSGLRSSSEQSGPHARASLRRPADDRRPGHGRPRDRRGRARGDDGRRPGRRRRAHLRHRDRGRRRAVSIGVEPELSPALHAALEAGEPVPVQPTSIADGLERAVRGRALPRRLPRAASRASSSSPRTSSRTASASSTSARSSPPSPPERRQSAALLAGKIELEPGETVVAVVSGGNVATQTAAAILAGE